MTGLEARQALQHAREEAQQLVDQAQAALQQRKLQHSHSDPAASRKQPLSGAAGQALASISSKALHGASNRPQGQQLLHGTAPGLLQHPFQGSMPLASDLTISHRAHSSAIGQLQMAGAAHASNQTVASFLDRMQSAQGTPVLKFCISVISVHQLQRSGPIEHFEYLLGKCAYVYTLLASPPLSWPTSFPSFPTSLFPNPSKIQPNTPQQPSRGYSCSHSLINC